MIASASRPFREQAELTGCKCTGSESCDAAGIISGAGIAFPRFSRRCYPQGEVVVIVLDSVANVSGHSVF